MEKTAVKKETSIEWLMTQLYKKGFIKEVDGSEPINLMNQAKEMEKEQAVDFAYDIADDLACGVLSNKDIEDRYTEFFKSE